MRPAKVRGAQPLLGRQMVDSSGIFLSSRVGRYGRVRASAAAGNCSNCRTNRVPKLAVIYQEMP